MFARSILALLSSIKAREEGRPGVPRPLPVMVVPPTVFPAQQAQYNRYDQERFIRQKEGKFPSTSNTGSDANIYISFIKLTLC